MHGEEKRITKCSPLNVGWLSILPSSNNRPSLSKMEFQDTLRMRYGLMPIRLPHLCDGCNDNFSLDHALNCRKGGLIIRRHDNLKKDLGYLLGLSITPPLFLTNPVSTIVRINRWGMVHPQNVAMKEVIFWYHAYGETDSIVS